LQTMRKLFSNIVSSPHEEKFRKVKKTNPAIQQKLFPQCFDVLRAAGFEDSGELLVYRVDPGQDLHEAMALVESLLMSLGEEPVVAAIAAKASSSSATPASSSTAVPQSRRAMQEERDKKNEGSIAEAAGQCPNGAGCITKGACQQVSGRAGCCTGSPSQWSQCRSTLRCYFGTQREPRSHTLIHIMYPMWELITLQLCNPSAGRPVPMRYVVAAPTSQGAGF
jgi:hypothetical protein